MTTSPRQREKNKQMNTTVKRLRMRNLFRTPYTDSVCKRRYIYIYISFFLKCSHLAALACYQPCYFEHNPFRIHRKNVQKNIYIYIHFPQIKIDFDRLEKNN